jgi:hypothetical protein
MEELLLKNGFSWRCVSRCAALCFLLCSIFYIEGAQARYFVDEGKGYALCERLNSYLNKSAAFKKGKSGEAVRDPALMKKILTFSGFTRPPSVNIPLAGIKDLIILMGEVDFLQFLNDPLYSRGKEGINRYLEDRRLGKISSEVLEKTKKIGERYYQSLYDGKAVVSKIVDSHELGAEVLLQIEYFDVDGEVDIILRHVDDALRIPLPKNSSLDWSRPNSALVLWRRNYYVLFGDQNYFEIKANAGDVFPKVCHFGFRD